MKMILSPLLLLIAFTAHVRAQDPKPCTPDMPYLPWEIYNPRTYDEYLEPGHQVKPSVSLQPLIQSQIPVVQLPLSLDVHFVSPEPIQYVDISAKNIIGDLPLKNVLRIRYKDSARAEDAVVTIAGEKFIAQYHIRPGGENVPLQINIDPADTKPLDISGVGLSQNQLRQLALGLYLKKPGRPKEKAKAFGIYGTVNHLYTIDNYIFIDLGFRNKTDLKFDIEQFRFHIDDKKITKATNVQSVEVKPLMALVDNTVFNKYYRNIYVLPKLTFPGNKVLHVELSEKQISSRIIHLDISYKDVLDADMIPL
ncbi:MAG TPA: conjugative transposon protein TraN [Mucilaginibacter sp.]|nr:conjugative transposon protein TraN [Mucilaginibacter sp.]